MKSGTPVGVRIQTIFKQIDWDIGDGWYRFSSENEAIGERKETVGFEF